MNLVRASLRYPQVTIALTVMLVACGAYALLRMPRREDPKIHVRTGVVAAFYPGASAAEVENQVTQKVEQRLFKIEGVRREKTYSTSMNGAMFVNVELEDSLQDTEKFWSKLRLDMAELKATDLPDGVMGPVVDYDFGDTVAVLIAIHGDRYDYRELKDYSERIEAAIRRIRVCVEGQTDRRAEGGDRGQRLPRPALAVCRDAGSGHEGAGRPQYGPLCRRGADRARQTAHSVDRRVSDRGTDPARHGRCHAHGTAGLHRRPCRRPARVQGPHAICAFTRRARHPAFRRDAGRQQHRRFRQRASRFSG